MKIIATDYTIQTDSNTISGADNVVGGYGNNVTGTQNIVGGGAGGGLGNTVSGARNLVVGLGHSISGSDNIIGGSYQQGGNNLIVTGSQNNNSGNNIIMAGYLSGFSGGYVLGVGVNIGGAGQYVLAVGNQVGGNGSYNCNIGSINYHNVDWSFSFGTQMVHNQQYGYGFGSWGTTNNYGQLVQSLGKFTNAGDAQSSVMTMRIATTDANPTELTLDGTNYLLLENYKAYAFKATIVGATASTGANTAMYELSWHCWRGANAASLTVNGLVVNTIYETDSGLDATVTADTTNGRPAIKVTGLGSTTIRWVARLEMTEVGVTT